MDLSGCDAIYSDPEDEHMCGEGRMEKVSGKPFLRATYVKFLHGAHTKWHYHTGEQILMGTFGKGFVQFQDGARLTILVGSRIHVPVGIWHRHGANPGETFIHLAITSGETEWDIEDPCGEDVNHAAQLGASPVMVIASANQFMLDAEEAGMAEKLRPLLAQKFIIIRSTGETSDRESFLGSVPSNARRGRICSMLNVQLINSEHAIYTCLVATQTNPDGTSNKGNFLNTRLFVKESNEWRCSQWQVVKVSI